MKILEEKKTTKKKRKVTDYHIRGYSKKVYRDLDLIETCSFLHGVQHVLINIFEGFLDIANF